MLNIQQTLSLHISISLIVTPVLGNSLQTDGSTKTTLDSSRNNIPIVNIADPNKNGLSHNKFKNYNVNKEGLILNNSKADNIKTQLGGYIFGNKNLNSEAKAILNEVTSTNRTFLKGYTEVAGQKADLIIANPNGITINGAGFINTSNITLTTGKPNIINDTLHSFQVLGGDISIQENGLDTTGVNDTNIYTHYLQLNGAINAKNLDIKLGLNTIEHATKQIISSQNSGATQNLLLDSSLIGGMYANRIVLVGTDKGLGVNLPPEVLASTGEISISNDGKLRLHKLNAQKDIDIVSTNGDIELKDTLYTKQNLHIKTNKDIAIDDTLIASKEHMDIGATKIINDGTIIAGLNEDYSLNEQKDLKVQATSLINNNKLQASKTIDIIADKLQNNKNILSLEQLNFQTKEFLNKDTISSDTIDIQSDSFTNKAQINGETLEVQNSGLLTNEGLLYSDKSLKIISNKFINSSEIQSANSIDITTDSFINNKSFIANNDIFIDTDSFSNTYNILANKTIDIQANDLFTQNGEISANSITIDTSRFSAIDTKILALDTIDINALQSFKNSGTIQTNHTLNLSSKRIENTDTLSATHMLLDTTELLNSGNIVADDMMSLKTITLENSSLIHSNNILNIQSDYLKNLQDISSINTLLIGSREELINNGLIQSTNTLQVLTNNFINDGTLLANDLTLEAGIFLNTQDILAANNIQIDINDNIVNKGVIQADNFLQFRSKKLDNEHFLISHDIEFNIEDSINNGYILSENNFIINTNNSFLNTNLIHVMNDFNIFNTQNFNNSNTIDTKSFDLHSVSFQNSGDIGISESMGVSSESIDNLGSIIATNDISLQTQNMHNSGLIHSNKNLEIQSDEFVNSKALSAKEDLNIKTRNFTGTGAEMIATNINIENMEQLFLQDSELLVVEDINILSNSFTNYSLLQANGLLDITTNTLLNNGDLFAKDINLLSDTIYNYQAIMANNNLKIDQNSLIQNDGVIQADNLLEIKDTKNLENSSFIFAGDAKIHAQNFINEGVIESSKTLLLYANSLENTEDMISNKKFVIDTDSLDNSGTLHSNSDLEIKSDTFKNTHLITSSKKMFVDTNFMRIQNGELSANDLVLNVDELIILNSDLLALNNMTIKALNKITNDGNIKVKNSLDISADILDNKKHLLADTIKIDTDTKTLNNGQIQGNEALKFLGKEVENNNLISSYKNIYFDTLNNLDNRYSQIIAGDSVTLATNIFDNSYGELIAGDTIEIETTKETINKNGDIKSNKNIKIQTPFLNNENGKIEAYGDLFLDLRTIELTNSNLHSRDKLTLNIDALENIASSSISSRNTLKINANNYITNRADLLADGNLILNTDGTLINYKTISSGGTLNLSANGLINHSTISSGLGQSYINILNDISNNSRISSMDKLYISGKNITNGGYFNAGSLLTLDANNLINNKTLFSANNMNLYISNTLTNNEDANIFAIGNIKMAKDSSNNKIAKIVNNKAYIQTYNGDINIYANSFENTTDGVEKTTETVSGGSLTLYPMSLYQVGEVFYDSIISVRIEGEDESYTSIQYVLKQQETIEQELRKEEVEKGNYYNIANVSLKVRWDHQTGTYSQKYFVINNVEYEESEVLGYTLVENQTNFYEVRYKDKSAVKDTLVKYTNIDDDKVFERLKDYYSQYGLNVKQQDNYLFSTTPHYYIDLKKTHPYEAFRTITNTKENETLVSMPTKKATLASGKNLNIQVDNFTNYLSEVSASNNIHFSSTNVDNKGEILYQYNINTGKYFFCKKKKCVAYALPQNTSKLVLDHIASTIQAGGSITGTIDKFNNGNVDEYQSISVSTQVEDLSTKKSGVSISKHDIEDKASIDIEHKSKTITHASTALKDTKLKDISHEQNKLETNSIKPKELVVSIEKEKIHNNTTSIIVHNENKQIETLDIELPKDQYGLFVQTKDPTSNFIIETNPEFTIYENFISSDYMLQRIGFDPDSTLKRLGDGFYEQRMIRESIFAQTGRRFLDSDVISDNAQYQRLMENGLQAQKDLNLAPGISLTQAQINRLNSNIVWMEEKIVNGEKVLAPVVYIANADSYKLEGAKILANKDIELNVGELNNGGKIEAKEDIFVNAKEMINNIGGEIQADGDLTLIAQNGIRNISADIKARDINLVSIDGDIINERYSKEVDYSRYHSKDIKTLLGKESNIIADGELYIQTLKDISIGGSNLFAQDINLEARSININSILDTKDYFSGGGKNYVKESSIINLQSNLEANNINLDAVMINIEASNLFAKESIDIDAKEVNIYSSQDSYNKEVKMSKKGTFSSKTVEIKQGTVKNVESSIKANNINIDTNSLNLIASNIKANEAQITSDIVNLISGKDSDSLVVNSDKSGGFTRTIIDQGSIKEYLKEAKIEVSDKLIVNGKDITAQLTTDKLIKTLSSQHNLSLDQINLIKQTLNNKTWYDKSTSLSGVGALVVAVVVAVVTAGAGAAVVGALGGATAGTVTATVQAAVAQSLITGVTTQLATSVITGNSFKLDTQSLVKGAVTAGVLSYAGELTKLGDLNLGETGQKIAQATVDTTIKTGIQSAVYGSDFEDTFLLNAANALGAGISKEIGESYQNEDLNYFTHKLAHAATGAATAELMGADGASGAIGAVAGEIIGEAVGTTLIQDGEYSSVDSALVGLTSQLGTIATANMLDKDVDTAMNSADIAKKNNTDLYMGLEAMKINVGLETNDYGAVTDAVVYKDTSNDSPYTKGVLGENMNAGFEFVDNGVNNANQQMVSVFNGANNIYDGVGNSVNEVYDYRDAIGNDIVTGFEGGLNGYRDVRDNAPLVPRYMLIGGMTVTEMGLTAGLSTSSKIAEEIFSGAYLDTIPITIPNFSGKIIKDEIDSINIMEGEEL